MTSIWNTKLVDQIWKETLTGPNTGNTAREPTNLISELVVQDAVFHMVIK